MTQPRDDRAAAALVDAPDGDELDEQVAMTRRVEADAAAWTATDVDEAPAALRVQGLAESMVVMLVLMVLQRSVGFVRSILFCRWLPAEQLGEWDLAYDFLLLAAPIAVLALPGCLGRYVEHYRQRDQLRAFLRRIALASGGLTIAAVAIVAIEPTWFSHLIFGRDDHVRLTLLWAATLAIIVAMNFLTELFTALRQARLTAAMQFVNGIAFAAVSLTLVYFWRATSATVLLAFALASVVSTLVACTWLRSTWRALPVREAPLAGGDLWRKVLPFVLWVWVSNWLTNLFGLADRYMIVHYSGMPNDVALAQVGEYHASRVVPLLLVTVAFMLGAMLTPYLTHDWEAGRRREVSARANLTLKLSALGLLAGGLAILLAAGPMFTIAFENKYALGQAVLPMTLAYCSWFGLTTIVQSYLWCAERARQGSLALLAGLVVNVALNLVLLPRYGLWGAVVATVIGNALALVLAYVFSLLDGLRFDVGTLILLVAPGAFALGVWPSLATVAAVGVAIACGRLLSADERRDLRSFADQYWERLQAARRRTRSPVN